jgi:hypothetical protein
VSRWQRVLLVVAGLALLSAAWLWWNRPGRVNVAAYVPADALVYLEANDLPGVLEGLTSTDAWRAVARSAGLREDFGATGWLARFVARTGIGPADAVVLARAQVGVAVLGFEAADVSSDAPQIRPRLALVAETHTGQGRTISAVEKLVGDFARDTYGEVKFERAERDGPVFLTWTQAQGGRKILAAVAGGFVAIGTDEAALTSCLAVRRGERPSLADDPQFARMLERVGAGGALAFGYVPASAAPKLSEIAALFFAGRLAADPGQQSAVASMLPQLAGRLTGGAAWSTRAAGAGVEDNYFFALPDEIPARLSVALEVTRAPTFETAKLVPADAHQLTRYGFAEPLEAWRGVNAVVSSHLDITLALPVGKLFEASLQVYGIHAPRDFLRAVGPEVTTVRLDRDGQRLALVASARDEGALRRLVRGWYGAGARAEGVGDAELIVAADEELGAAGFAPGFVVTGDAESVRRCLKARESGQTAASLEAFRLAAPQAGEGAAAPFLTLTDDREAARGFLNFLSRQGGARRGQRDAAALERALAARPYAVTETRLAPDGFERRTRSAFGQLGALAVLVSSNGEAGK